MLLASENRVLLINFHSKSVRNFLYFFDFSCLNLKKNLKVLRGEEGGRMSRLNLTKQWDRKLNWGYVR